MEKALVQENSTCLKVVLYGPESTGKTTMARQLAAYYKTNWVPEYAREYLQKKYDEVNEICAEDDLIPIAKGQIQSENNLAKTAHKVLFSDTNVMQTYYYGKAYYQNFTHELLKKVAFQHTYDLYFLTYIDTPWEDDDLRDKPTEREEMFLHFQKSLEENNIPYVLLKGNEEERMKVAIEKVDELLAKG